MASKANPKVAQDLAPKHMKPILPRRISSFASELIGHGGINMSTPPTKETKSLNLKAPKKSVGGSTMTKKQAVITKPSLMDPKGAKKEKPQFDKEAEDKFDAMIKGDMTDLPPLPKSIVKIFLSSTFSDMREERNMLAREVYPRLQKICAAQDLEFQVVDMRWGVTDDSQNDHSVEKICLLEVENCQKDSLGPNFMLITGDRYGFQPIPTELSVDEFSMIRKEIQEMNLENKDLLDTWYKRDDNAIQPVYILQTVRSMFPFFGDYSPGCDEPRARDTANWWKTFEALKKLLQTAAHSLLKKEKISDERYHDFYKSVTEFEIDKGILKANDPQLHAVLYDRTFQGLTDANLVERNADKHIDVIKQSGKSEINQEIVKLRKELSARISKVLPASNIRSFLLPWKPGGLDPEAHPEHKTYLTQFCETFVADCQRLIEGGLSKRRNQIRQGEYYSRYSEVIHHLQFCKTKCQTFCGQEETLEKARSYILDKDNRSPLVIHAPSGAGKTSVMAMIMSIVGNWFRGEKHIKIIRFLGTSPDSINIYDVLFAVLGQLADAAELIMEPVRYKNMKNLIEYFPRFLRVVSNALKIPVVIILDSLDQLSPANNAYALEWVPTLLPPNIKLILSTLPEEHNIKENLRKLLPENCMVAVPILPETTGREIIKKYLGLKNRTLTEEQVKFLLSIFKNDPSPLFLKLLLDRAEKWYSFTEVSELHLTNTVLESINTLFQQLEKKYGLQLISSALGFISVGLNGITDIEIEDALSCDDRVLDEVYRFHDPPVNGIVRIPPVLWARIRHDIQEYIVERMSHGKTTLHWYHRQFIAAATKRYASDEKAPYLNKILVDVFLHEDGLQRDITLSQRKNLKIPNADRQITPQPCTVTNKRKLSCLAYHVVNARALIEPSRAKSLVFCNFKFLQTKIAAFSVSHVTDDLSSYLETFEDEELLLLRNFLSTSKDNLRLPVRLAVCLLAYINCDEGHFHLKKLLAQAREYLITNKSPLLLPAFCCLAARRDISEALDATLKGFSNIVTENSEYVLLKTLNAIDDEDQRDRFAVVNTVTEDLQQVTLANFCNFPKISKSGKEIFFTTNSSLVCLYYEDRKFKKVGFETTSQPLAFEVNDDRKFGVIHLSDEKLLLYDLMTLKKMGIFSFEKSRNYKVSRVHCTNDETSPIIIVVGEIAETDKIPRSQSFLAQFRVGKENPVKTVILDATLKPELGSFLHEEEMIVIGTENLLKSANIGSQLMRYETKSLNQIEPAIIFPQKIIQIYAETSSSSSRLAVLSREGVVFIADGSSTKILSEIKLNNPVTQLGVKWEKNVVLLGDLQGYITVYDIKLNKNLGSFFAHAISVKRIVVLEEHIVSMGEKLETKIWSFRGLHEDMQKERKAKQEKQITQPSLLEQKSTSAADLSLDGKDLITCTEEKFVRIWSVANQELQREFKVDLVVDTVQCLADRCIAVFEKSKQRLEILDQDYGKQILKTSPNVLAFVVNNDRDKIYTVNSQMEGSLAVEVIDLKLKKITKSLNLKKGIERFLSIDAVLSTSERFLVLQTQITNEEYETIVAMWKKTGSFQPQHHRYRFTAVDLTQGTGGLMPCLRQLSKIPTLGEKCIPFSGNVMLITTRRWIVFWDIPTGKCDQKPSKVDRAKGMFYRPDWLGQECQGTSRAIVQSPNKEFLAVGSEDGYMFLYNTTTGLPLGHMKPPSCHTVEVMQISISPDSRWVASACRNNTLKLWDSASAKEQFSLRVDSEVQKINFTCDSKYVAVFTGSQSTRLLLFQIHPGA
ncbi:hypothetical protein CHS0354_039489 [Potamilus streckersoni]|uniref:NACHT and WD repeat domain-containing protein 1 n=1 Tax=Potamilus streckersoni TaxID=2493646 RepID=A0AAE0TKL9_9BIVA|nr:hypothetical protein CHS0354_039489 [Potamilus streckersoni]